MKEDYDVEVKVKTINGSKPPRYSREGDACLDCYIRIADDRIKIPAHSRCKVYLGFAIELPHKWEAVIRPRSGRALEGIDVVEGTIDENYRGECCATVVNTTDSEYTIYKDERVCQMAIRKAPLVKITLTDTLSESNRGSSGFGSSGK